MEEKSILEVAALLASLPEEKRKPYESFEEATEQIKSAPRVQEAWLATYNAMHDIPEKDEEFLQLFDEKLSALGEIPEFDKLGAEMGMGLMINSFEEMIEKGLVLPGKEAGAQKLIDRVTSIKEVLDKHGSVA